MNDQPGQGSCCDEVRGRIGRAFTLVEMLLVISLIMLLISMLLPSLGHAKANARSAICKSNLHQQTIGLIAYSDMTRFYPGAHTWSHNTPGNNWIVWAPRLREYTQSASTEWFWCPEAGENAEWKITYGSGLPAKYGYRTNEVRLEWYTPFSYGYNNWGTRDFSVPQYGLGGLTEHPTWGELPARSVRQPANMIAIGDSQVDGVWDAFIDTDQPQEYPAIRHPGESSNLGYVDGHVESNRLNIILAPENLGKWNNDGLYH
ncbi:MAG: hypothetical protein WD768_14635, partial [Phycisphaeraceae bacterium]